MVHVDFEWIMIGYVLIFSQQHLDKYKVCLCVRAYVGACIDSVLLLTVVSCCVGLASSVVVVDSGVMLRRSGIKCSCC